MIFLEGKVIHYFYKNVFLTIFFSNTALKVPRGVRRTAAPVKQEFHSAPSPVLQGTAPPVHLSQHHINTL